LAKEENIKKPATINAKDSTINIFLNVVIFFLAAIIIYLAYSILIKISGNNPVGKEEKLSVSEIIQVEVLNGCGISGVADRFTDYLRNNNFDVVNVSNYITKDISNTLVIDRRGNRANALKTARMLGVKPEHVIQQLNDDYFVDVTVIVGKDCNILTPLK
jgi:hypothetical protein